MMTTIFAEKVLKEKEHVFAHYSDLLVQRLKESKGKPVAMADWYNFTTFDIVGDLLFGESLGLLDNSDYIPWVRSITDFLKAFAVIVVLYEYRLFRFFWSLMPNKMLQSLRQTHFRYTNDKLERYLARPDKERSGILKMLLQGGSHRGLLLKELYPNAPILVFGGSETSATSLRYLTFLLLKNPVTMEKLVREIRETFSSMDEMTYDALASLKYLNACIEEALRVYTPCTNALPRKVQPEGANICGQWVPGGTNVSVAMFSLFRSLRYFHRPDSFVPERWLDNAEGLDPLFANDNKAVMQPFMYGPHNCPGKK
jgi:cytochrome P450